MTDVSEIEERLKSAVTATVLPIQTFQDLDESAVTDLLEAAADVARALKGRPDVPKSVLQEIRATVHILRNESPHHGAGQRLMEVSEQLDSLLGLIIFDEAPEDRQPGVPRII